MKRSAGLTLIELMVTLAIVAILTSAALATVTTMARSQAVRERADVTNVRQWHVERLLAEDFRHATRFRDVQGGFELDSRANLDPKTLDLRHLPATIAYTVTHIESRAWLVRTQRTAAEGNFVELVCPAVRTVALNVTRDPAAAADAWQKLPGSAGVSIALEETGAPAIALAVRTGAM